MLAALDWYAEEAPHMVVPFVNALEKAVARIERNPGAGSPRYAHALNIPHLRFWPLTKFPYAEWHLL